MSLESVVIIIGAVINFTLISLMKRKKVQFFFFIIFFWWFFWLFISSLSIGGLFMPKLITYYLFIGMISFVNIGGFMYLFIKKTKKINSSQRNFLVNPNSLNFSWMKTIYQANYFFALPVTLFFFQKSVRYFISNPLALSTGYRSEVFRGDILFSAGQFLFYNLIVSPIPMTSLFIGCALYILEDNIHLFLLSSAILSLQSIMTGGRFNFLIILMVYAFAFLYKNNFSFLFIVKFIKTIKKNYKIFIVFFVAIYALTNITLSRVGTKLNTQEIFVKYFIEYNTLGFTMFNQELQSKTSLLNQEFTYGRSSLGIIERLSVFILRRFDRSIESTPSEIGKNLDEPRILGANNGQPIYYNAFGTVLYSIYRDGGVFFVALFSLIYGFYLAKFSLLIRTSPNIYNISIILALLYLGIFGLYQPLLISNYWSYLIYIKIFVPNKPYYIPIKYN